MLKPPTFHLSRLLPNSEVGNRLKTHHLLLRREIVCSQVGKKTHIQNASVPYGQLGKKKKANFTRRQNCGTNEGILQVGGDQSAGKGGFEFM